MADTVLGPHMAIDECSALPEMRYGRLLLGRSPLPLLDRLDRLCPRVWACLCALSSMSVHSSFEKAERMLLKWILHFHLQTCGSFDEAQDEL